MLARSAHGAATAALVLALAAGCGAGPAADSDPVPPQPPYLRLLGTAQDGGLPHAACACDRCRLARADPRHERLVTSLAVVAPPGLFLVDASPDLPRQLERLSDLRRPPAGRVDRAPLDGILLTHAHVGHYLGLAWLGYEAVHTTALPVWASPRMAAFLRANGPWSRLVERREIELREIEPGASFELAPGVSVEPLGVPHRDEDTDTLGFVFRGPRRSVLYVPDTDAWERWQPPLLEQLDGIDVALLDGTFYSPDELPGRDLASIPHPLISRSMDLLQPPVDAGELEVFFTHMNHSNPALLGDGPERRELEARGFRLAEDGQEIAL